MVILIRTLTDDYFGQDVFFRKDDYRRVFTDLRGKSFFLEKVKSSHRKVKVIDLTFCSKKKVSHDFDFKKSQ
jgi:hypothetical protein